MYFNYYTWAIAIIILFSFEIRGRVGWETECPSKSRKKLVAIVRITHSKGLSYSVGIDDEEQIPLKIMLIFYHLSSYQHFGLIRVMLSLVCYYFLLGFCLGLLHLAKWVYIKGIT